MPPSTAEPDGAEIAAGACGMSDDGLAMKTTPTNETTPATCSLLVNGSLIRIEQAQQATVGARNVITVASERGRYCNESLESCISQVLKGRMSDVTYNTFRTLLFVREATRKHRISKTDHQRNLQTPAPTRVSKALAVQKGRARPLPPTDTHRSILLYRSFEQAESVMLLAEISLTQRPDQTPT